MCVVTSPCFNLHFPDDIWYGGPFQKLLCHLYICFSGVSKYQPIFKLVVSFLLLSFKTTLCQVYDLQIFSPILWVVFSLPLWCSLKQERFKFWWSPFSWVTCTWAMSLLVSYVFRSLLTLNLGDFSCICAQACIS